MEIFEDEIFYSFLFTHREWDVKPEPPKPAPVEPAETEEEEEEEREPFHWPLFWMILKIVMVALTNIFSFGGAMIDVGLTTTGLVLGHIVYDETIADSENTDYAHWNGFDESSLDDYDG